MEYLLITVSCSLLGSYFSLAMRIGNWSLIPQVLMVSVMASIIDFSLKQNVMPTPALAVLIVVAALAFRWQARRHFMVIDWQQIKPKVQESSSGMHASH